MTSSFPIYLSQPSPYDPERVWVLLFERSQGQVYLGIPNPGGPMDSMALSAGQDDWIAEWVEGRPYVERVWGTAWRVEEEQVAVLIRELQEEHGAQTLALADYLEARTRVQREAR